MQINHKPFILANDWCKNGIYTMANIRFAKGDTFRTKNIKANAINTFQENLICFSFNCIKFKCNQAKSKKYSVANKIVVVSYN